jgi:hypothetical protein
LPKYLLATNVDEILKEKVPRAIEIDKRITENKKITEVLVDEGIGDVYNKVKNNNRKINEFARYKNNSADEFFDYHLPDSSNKSVAANLTTINKARDLISNRLASKITIANRTNLGNYRGITSGELYENLNIWSQIGIHGSKEKPHKKQSHSKKISTIFSFGADTLFNNGFTLGINYAYSNAKVDVLGGMSGTKLSNDKISSHIFGTYASMGLGALDSELSFMFSLSKHKAKDTIVGDLEAYKSNLICVNTAVIYPLDIEKFNCDISMQFGLTRVHVDKHQNKYSGNNKHAKHSQLKKSNKPHLKPSINLQPEQNKNIITLGLSTATYDSFIIKDKMNMDYRLSVGYKFDIAGEDKIDIAIDTNASNKVKVKNRNPGGHSINFDIGLNLKAYKNLQLSINANYSLGMSPPSHSYGANLNIGYVF